LAENDLLRYHAYIKSAPNHGTMDRIWQKRIWSIQWLVCTREMCLEARHYVTGINIISELNKTVMKTDQKFVFINQGSLTVYWQAFETRLWEKDSLSML